MSIKLFKPFLTEANPTASVTVMELDLASLQSINQFVDKMKKRDKPVHILINNAGVMACQHSTTADGFEMQMGTNHFGPFHLTRSLLPLLSESGTKESPARIVNLSSCANLLFSPPKGIDFDDIAGVKRYHPWGRYGESKLAFRHLSLVTALSSIWLMIQNGHAKLLGSEPKKTIAQGASTTVLAALDPQIRPGEYYANCQVSHDIHVSANDPDLQVKLWNVSEKMVDEALLKIK